MARPSFEEIKKYESLIISRDDHRYSRIEKYTDEEFANSIIFEFFLRVEEFKNKYTKLYEIIERKIANKESDFYPMSKKFNALEDDFRKAFESFNYNIYYIIRYIYCEVMYSYNTEAFSHNSACTTQIGESNLFDIAQMLFKKVQIGTISYDMQEDYGEFKQFFKMIEYRYKLPVYEVVDNINIKLNLMLSKETLLNQTSILLDELYKKRNNSNNISMRTEVGKKNIKKTFANYFYVYDHIQMGIPKGMIKNEIDKCKESGGISLNTINKHMEQMQKLFTDQKFTRLSLK